MNDLATLINHQLDAAADETIRGEIDEETAEAIEDLQATGLNGLEFNYDRGIWDAEGPDGTTYQVTEGYTSETCDLAITGQEEQLEKMTLKFPGGRSVPAKASE